MTKCFDSNDRIKFNFVISVHPETFKITKQHRYGNITWDLHTQSDVKSFDTLQELAKGIKTESANKLRLAPSDYDKAPLLLLCLPESQLTVIKAASVDIEMELRQKLPQIIDPANELRKYIRKWNWFKKLLRIYVPLTKISFLHSTQIRRI